MKRASFTTETALAAAVVDWLRAELWTVYQEVVCCGSICDLVATRGPLVWAIETKLSFGQPVLEQARNWIGRANWVSVATPHGGGSGGIIAEWARWKGIGWLTAGHSRLDERIPPAFTRVRGSGMRTGGITGSGMYTLRGCLRPQQITGVAAGGNAGGYYTPFRDTCQKVAAVVASNPGVGMRDLLAGVGATHYASSAGARASIAHWAEKGKIPGVELRREGKTVRLYPTEVP